MDGPTLVSILRVEEDWRLTNGRVSIPVTVEDAVRADLTDQTLNSLTVVVRTTGAPVVGAHFFPLLGLAPCRECGQPQGVDLKLSSTGFGVTTSIQHRALCSALRCPHGVLWAEDCEKCDAIRAQMDEEP